MYRFGILFFILASIICSTVAPNVRCPPNRSIGDNYECVEQKSDSSQTDSDEIPNTENQASTTPTTTIHSTDDGIDNGDQQGGIDLSTTGTPINFRKRRSVNNIKHKSSSNKHEHEETKKKHEHIKSSSSSQEVEGSGENDPANSIEKTSNLIGSSEEVLNISDMKMTTSNETMDLDSTNDSSSSIETGSGEGTVSNVETAKEEQLVELQHKVVVWQKAVDNYLSTGERRRKRRQAAWPQLFSSNSYTSTSKTSTGSMATYATGVSDAVEEALKPAMELMTQGVDLLSDLYSAKLTKSFDTAALDSSPNNVTSVSSDQFRNQLKQLQGKLGDLGQQLQRVVNSFQQLQIPFFDNIMSGGLLGSNGAPPLVLDGKNGKAKQYKDRV